MEHKKSSPELKMMLIRALLKDVKKRMLPFPFEPCVIGSERAEGENVSTHNESTCPTCRSREAWECLQDEING